MQGWKQTSKLLQNLLLEPIPDRSPAINKVTRHIPTLITQEKNEVLMRPITIEEVDQAIKEMPVGKAPGLDGFTTDFFHHCWPMVREEVWQLVEESELLGRSSQALNATFLTLIPKEEKVSHPQQFSQSHVVQCDLQNHHQGNHPLTQAYSSFYHF
jgi:hypothetical protein